MIHTCRVPETQIYGLSINHHISGIIVKPAVG